MFHSDPGDVSESYDVGRMSIGVAGSGEDIVCDGGGKYDPAPGSFSFLGLEVNLDIVRPTFFSFETLTVAFEALMVEKPVIDRVAPG